MDGETADEDKQQWWSYTVNGTTAAYGVDNQPISDNDIYLFTLHEGRLKFKIVSKTAPGNRNWGNVGEKPRERVTVKLP